MPSDELDDLADRDEIDRLFEETLDLPEEDREGFLRERCPDPARRDRVRRLLARVGEDPGFLGIGDSVAGRRLLDVAEELGVDRLAAPTREEIPGFRLVERLGEGGMGEVWRCEQLEPLRREVAIKLIRPGMDSREVVARFETERQALGLMTHRNIARVFGGGTTASGRPFFVMELVDGEPITAYCDRLGLRTRDRLELFTRVCEAVQHAHQKGIIHRDLKPTNVLVATEDGRPVPKVIDFGIARAVERDPSGRSLLTRLGDLVGTPEYMSPEQAEAELDVDTRTDIYSLGVLLYELLVGVRPFDLSGVRRGLEELRRKILETDPLRPSTRIRHLGDERTKLASRRGASTAAQLERRLRGDLDWITMKALEKDRERRYASPGELAADVRRHLEDQPVLAGPPSAGYRLQKLLRRHRGAALSAAVVILSLGLGTGISLRQAIRATRAEGRALQEARASAAVTDFLVALFEVSDPDSGRGRTITAQELLEAGSARLETDLAASPPIQARIMTTIADIQGKLGLYDRAEPLLEQALVVQEQLLGESAPEVIALRRRLGGVAVESGALDDADEHYRRALSAARRHLGERHPETALILDGAAHLELTRGRPEEALGRFREALAIFGELGLLDAPEAVVAWTGFGATLNRMGRYPEADEAHRRALSVLEATRGPDHPELVPVLTSLATNLGDLGRDAESEDLHRRALRIAVEAYGEEHTFVAMAMTNLGAFHGRRGDLDEARRLFERAAEIRTRIYGPDHPMVARLDKNLGRLATMRGDYEVAEMHLLRALEIDAEALGEETEAVAWTALALVSLYRETGRFDEAAPLVERALGIYEATIGRDNGEYSRALGAAAQLALARGLPAEAEALFRETLEIQEAVLPPGHPWLAVTLEGLAHALERQDRTDEAVDARRRALELRPEQPGREPSAVATSAPGG